jgi:DNA-binding NarL/FixJ family response regulator
MRLMLAEDSALLREGLGHTLAARSIEVAGLAADTSSLRQLVERQPPDVVLLDLRMPPTFTDEGLLAAEQIRAEHPDVAVLLAAAPWERPSRLRREPGRPPSTGSRVPADAEQP